MHYMAIAAWGMGKGSRQSNPFVACIKITQLLWFGFVITLRSLPVSSTWNSNKKPWPFKIHKVKTLFFREASWRSTLDRKASDPKQINRSLDVIWKWPGSCAAIAAQSQSMVTLNSFHHKREDSSNNVVHFKYSSSSRFSFPQHTEKRVQSSWCLWGLCKTVHKLTSDLFYTPSR